MAEFFRKKKKKCKLCEGKSLDYKETINIVRYISDKGKILPRRVTGACAKHQRYISNQVKRSRFMALIPFVR